MTLRHISINENKTLAEYSSEECQKVLDIYNHYYTKFGFDFPWVGYFIIDDNKVVGTCGFNGPPKFGKVEVAYWTFHEFEGKGIGSYACKELVTIAQKSNAKMVITAKTKPQKNAATRILEKNGFNLVGVIRNEGYEDIWFWKYQESSDKNEITFKSNF